MPGNKQWFVLRVPTTKFPVPGTDIELRDGDIPEPKDGEFLVKNLVLTVDPYLRGLFSTSNFYTGEQRDFPFIMEAGAVGRVIKSRNDKFKEGALVQGSFGWQEYAVSNGQGDRIIPDTMRPSHALGALGMPGATAYFGFTRICDPKEGDTVVVSGAAGAVGLLVGQIAKLLGCKTIGFAGGKEKCDFILQSGFDHAIDYQGKTVAQLGDELSKVAPNGVDSYFENTGGPVTKAVIEKLKSQARVSVCGQIAHYGTEESTDVPLGTVLFKQLHIEGFIVHKWASEWPTAFEKLQGWIAEGKLKVQEDLTDGIDNVFDAFLELFHQGKEGKKTNLGKKIVRLVPDDEAVNRQTTAP